ncbi:Abortive infection bacteriophage resistance protein [Listeria fleischmannii subsp. fleischmannii]|uniref:Abortive infection bacteriophage resistance protein n=2 Tax=Listeria fleischmannii TaxID=1069827 RepID=A0A2X3HLZ2_9LIST|nr:Abortive infection bacteriophage resistance protein [Listeria fleischmannii subsp. fleischmannii]
MESFFEKDERRKIELFKKEQYYNKKQQLCYTSIYQKYYDNPPVWVALELMSYGTFVMFVEHYYSDVFFNKDNFKMSNELLKFAKNIRNKSAHSSPLILFIKPGKAINPFLKEQNKNYIKLSESQLRVKRIHDIFATFLLHKTYCSHGVQENKKEMLNDYKIRLHRTKDYYSSNIDIKRFFTAINILIDKLYQY